MLYTIEAKSEKYKELVNKLQTEKSRETVFGEIKELCENCRPSSPIICTEICQIWKLKRDFHDIFKASTKPSLTNLLSITKNSRRLKILEVLIENSCSLMELRDAMKEANYSHSLSVLRDRYIKPLIDLGLVKKESGLYIITPQGRNVFGVLARSEIAKLLINLKGRDEEILVALASSPRSYKELAKAVPRGTLYRSLDRLQRRGLVFKSNLSGYIFYFKAKRRPTRRLSPTEMRIFKALPREGISVRELGDRVGISVRRVYKYLRRLRYKKHVKKEKKAVFYSVTDTGSRLAQSLNIIRNITKC